MRAKSAAVAELVLNSFNEIHRHRQFSIWKGLKEPQDVVLWFWFCFGALGL